MLDIVELRKEAKAAFRNHGYLIAKMALQAADEIEQLRKLIEKTDDGLTRTLSNLNKIHW